jgi:hypothetical protein
MQLDNEGTNDLKNLSAKLKSREILVFFFFLLKFFFKAPKYIEPALLKTTSPQHNIISANIRTRT